MSCFCFCFALTCYLPTYGKILGGGDGNPLQSVFLAGESAWTEESGGAELNMTEVTQHAHLPMYRYI